MFNFLTILMLAMSLICIPSDDLFAGGRGNKKPHKDKAYDEMANDPRVEIWLFEGNKIYVSYTLTDLDFTQELPDLGYICFTNGESYYHKITKSDFGLKNNIHLRSIRCTNTDNQVPVSFSYLPNVEEFFAGGAYRKLEYIPSVFPNLKKLEISADRQDLAATLNNISKLEYLEKFQIEKWQGELTFTDEELSALSKMPHLKWFTIYGLKGRSEQSFDQEKINLLQTLLPNTSIRISITLHPWADEC